MVRMAGCGLGRQWRPLSSGATHLRLIRMRLISRDAVPHVSLRDVTIASAASLVLCTHICISIASSIIHVDVNNQPYLHSEAATRCNALNSVNVAQSRPTCTAFPCTTPIARRQETVWPTQMIYNYKSPLYTPITRQRPQTAKAEA